MTPSPPSPIARLVADDLRLDGEGRVAITNPAVAAQLIVAAAVKRRPVRRRPAKEGPNANCGYCNTVDGCSPENLRCNPNTVANCGCRKLG
jgi:hypothetical protein